ncbi:hypothetical protein [Nocardia grenadensis]|uniref:hypothetical protein n=1 Tax=Nocardia grenadensis TaxID=931537 RepID=UPI003D7448FF
MSTLVLRPEEHFGKTYDYWEQVPAGNLVHVHGKGFYLKLTDGSVVWTAQKNGPTKGWMFTKKIPSGPFAEVNRISYDGT